MNNFFKSSLRAHFLVGKFIKETNFCTNSQEVFAKILKDYLKTCQFFETVLTLLMNPSSRFSESQIPVTKCGLKLQLHGAVD